MKYDAEFAQSRLKYVLAQKKKKTVRLAPNMYYTSF